MSNWNFFRLRMNINGAVAFDDSPTLFNLTEVSYREFTAERGSVDSSTPWYTDVRIIGDKLYFMKEHLRKIFQYELSIPGDITSTWTFQGESGTFPLGDVTWGKNNMFFSSTGDKLFIFGHLQNEDNPTVGMLYRYNLTTAWDITSVNTTGDQQIMIVGYNQYSSDMDINWDGTEIIYINVDPETSVKSIMTIPLTTAWDLSTFNFATMIQQTISGYLPSNFAYLKKGGNEYLITSGSSTVKIFNKVGSNWQFLGDGDITGSGIIWIMCNDEDYVYALGMTAIHAGQNRVESRIHKSSISEKI